MSPKGKPRRTSRRAFLGLTAAGLAAGSVAGWQWGEVTRIVTERHKLRLPRWDANGFRVAQISDLHLVTPQAVQLALRAVDYALAERPEAVVITGDFLHGHNDRALVRVTDFLDNLPETDIPLIAVLGNHDYWIDDPRALIETLQGSPIKLLRNELASIGGVQIIGIDDGIAGRDRHHVLGPSADRNTLTLFHEPDFVDRIDRRSSLMLAGHSHGGQICLPGNWPLHTPRGARTYIRGYYPDAPVPLYVNRGIGTIGIPKRSFCAPEVTVLELNGEA